MSIIRGAGLLALCAGALAGYPSPPAYPTKIYVTASINSISRIDAVDSSFQMDFYLVFAWRDDRLFSQIDQELDPATQFHPSPEIINVGAFGLEVAGRRAPTRCWAAAARPRLAGERSRNAIIMCCPPPPHERFDGRPHGPRRRPLSAPASPSPVCGKPSSITANAAGSASGKRGRHPLPLIAPSPDPRSPPPPLGSASGTWRRRAPCFMREHSRHSHSN
jgi:hypothetical protein